MNVQQSSNDDMSLPAREEWIEICILFFFLEENMKSLPAREEWIEIVTGAVPLTARRLSLPAREEWIEITYYSSSVPSLF